MVLTEKSWSCTARHRHRVSIASLKPRCPVRRRHRRQRCTCSRSTWMRLHLDQSIIKLYPSDERVRTGSRLVERYSSRSMDRSVISACTAPTKPTYYVYLAAGSVNGLHRVDMIESDLASSSSRRDQRDVYRSKGVHVCVCVSFFFSFFWQ